jgi:hypothetical protein
MHIHLGLLSVAKELPKQTDVDRGMEKALARIAVELEKEGTSPEGL